MASVKSLGGAIRETSTEALEELLASLQSLAGGEKLQGEPTQPYLQRISDQVVSELARRNLAKEGLATSPYVTHVIGQLLGYMVTRYPRLETSHWLSYAERSRLDISYRARFTCEMIVNGYGGKTRSAHLDEALQRLHKQLAEQTAHLKKTRFPSEKIDPEVFELAERLQQIFCLAEATGTPATFVWSAYYRVLHYSFDQGSGYARVKVKDPKSGLAEAIAVMEKQAKLG